MMNAHRDSRDVIHDLPRSLPPPVAPAPWRIGADALRRHQLGQLAALCIEAASPLAFVASQFLHAGAPFLGGRATQWALFLESEEGISDLVHDLETGMVDATLSGRQKP